MRSQLTAATLLLAVGLAPALAQQDPLADPAVAAPSPQSDVKTDPKMNAGARTKADAKRSSKGEAKSARGTGKAAAIPPAPGGDPLAAPGGRNVTATGRTMPPTTGRSGATPVNTSTEAAMLKAQKAAEERNKAWDTKMRRTMSTICNGC